MFRLKYAFEPRKKLTALQAVEASILDVSGLDLNDSQTAKEIASRTATALGILVSKLHADPRGLLMSGALLEILNAQGRTWEEC